MDGADSVQTVDDTSCDVALGRYGPWVNLMTGAITIILLAVFAAVPGSKAWIVVLLLLLFWLVALRRWKKTVLLKAKLVRGAYLKR